MKSFLIEVYVWIGTKRYKIGCEMGWFSGSEFKLFGLDLFEVYIDNDGITIFGIQIAKLSFSVFAHESKI